MEVDNEGSTEKARTAPCQSIDGNYWLPSSRNTGRYFDGVGLFLRITETGSKNWIQKLTINGKQTSIGHGSYPAVSLAKARLSSG